MNNRSAKRQYSQLSQRIFLRYILYIIGIPLILTSVFFIAKFVCSMFIWQATDPLYYFLKILEALAPLIIIICTMAGFIFFTYKAMHRPFTYLDEVIDAAKLLAHPAEEPIILPYELNNIQNEFNLVREHSLRNAAAAREAEQRKNDLLVYLAHDLKTPLTSVIGYLTLLRDEPFISPELRAKYTDTALNKAERLEDLINEFFEITRFNLTSLTLETERTNLSRMLEQITYEFNPILAEKGLSWNINIAPDVSILCDRNKLERVFDNLIRNAVNYSYPNCSIFLSMNIFQSSCNILIKNHGKTIPPEKLERLFEQFFRLDASRSSSTGGSGLGLAIAKEIVELHGGTIHAFSENESISFAISLPVI